MESAYVYIDYVPITVFSVYLEASTRRKWDDK